MAENNKILRLRVLLCFWNDEQKTNTVTKIAKTLGKEKYTITRILDMLEREGLIDRSNNRKPKLTETGIQETGKYVRRIEVASNHLMYEGVEPEYAVVDSMYWALYNSDQTMRVIEATEERYRIKNEMQDKSRFTGAALCSQMKDGSYQFPFLIYKEVAKDGNHISMLDGGFLHPCTLIVKDGEGTIMLQRTTITKKIPHSNKEVSMKINRISYYDGGELLDAEVRGNLFLFPASVLQFVNVGQGIGRIFHGSVRLSFEGTSQRSDMKELAAIFTILI